MSKTDNLQLEIPSAADKHIFTTYKNNNEIIDEAYGQYLEDQETSQENIAMIESSTAQSNHAVGSYFMLDNVLHKATSAIASGETITPGSNATPITIEEALTALNTSLSNKVDLGNNASSANISQGASHHYGSINIAGDNGTYYIQFLKNEGIRVYDPSWNLLDTVRWGRPITKTPTYTVSSGVTVHKVDYVHIGYIVIVSMQITVPAATNGTTLVTFGNIPTPIRTENFVTMGNANQARNFVFSGGRVLKAAGSIDAGNWLAGTLIYTTNDTPT